MLKLLIDENLSSRLKKNLAEHFVAIKHVTALHLGFDNQIWDFAKTHDYIILTKDNDFLFLSLMYGCPPKVIGVKCGNKSTSYITQLIIKHKEAIKSFGLADDNENCYLEIT